MKKLCKNCRHWERNEQTLEGRCESEKFVYQEAEQNSSDHLVYWDYESYSAGFRTAENFGCIHFQKKL